MSMTVRISDEVGEEIRMIKPEDMSFSKAAETILRLVVKALYSDENESNNSITSKRDIDDFQEKLKRISESILLKSDEENKDYKNGLTEMESDNPDKSENENSKMRIMELENQILDLKKSEEHFLKIENEIEKISDLIMEKRKVITEKIKSDDEFLTDTDVDYTTLISVKSEQTYLMVSEKEQYPFILPDDKKPWCYMKWHVNEKFNTATLEYNYNPLATADVLHQKIMLISPLEQQIWYPHEGDMQTLMYICERRLLKTFNDKLPLWFQKGIQFVHDPDYTENLYAEQRKINQERKKRGLYEFESFRF